MKSKPKLRFLLVGCYVVAALPLRAQTLDLALDAIEHPAFSAQQVALRLAQGGAAELEVGRLRFGGREIRRLRLRCGEFSLSPQRVHCGQGVLRSGEGTLPVSSLPLEFTYLPANRQLTLILPHAGLGALAAWLPELADWHPGGDFDARLKLTATQIEGVLHLKNAAFGNAAGTQAGDKITATLSFKATREKTGWGWQVALDWPRGEWYVAPFYRNGAMRLSATGQLAPERWTVERARWTLDDLGQLDARLQWQPGRDTQPGQLVAAALSTSWLDLAAVGPQFVQPFLDARAGPKLGLSGQAQVELAFDREGLSHLQVDLQAAGVESGRHALQGLTARIPWRREAATQADFRVTGGMLGALPIGGFAGTLAMQGMRFDLPQLAMPFLDGRLLLENLHAEREADEWHWHLGAALEPVSMPALSQALGWPKMEGVLSAAIPKLNYAQGTLVLDGQVMVSVFDGYLAFDGLKLIEPFGTLPRLQADITARHLDLGMMTKTFSFGDISGYVDADLKGLVMAGMRPLAFDASLLSTPGDYPKRLSQRAVQNISSLGGAGAAAAIQRSFLQVFETFGYDRIGLRCHLSNGVCLMGGIEAPPDRLEALASRLGVLGLPAQLPAQGFVLIKGGGLPALNVIGYNRRVDWEELVARLKAVIAGNGKIELR